VSLEYLGSIYVLSVTIAAGAGTRASSNGKQVITGDRG